MSKLLFTCWSVLAEVSIITKYITNIVINWNPTTICNLFQFLGHKCFWFFYTVGSKNLSCYPSILFLMPPYMSRKYPNIQEDYFWKLAFSRKLLVYVKLCIALKKLILAFSEVFSVCAFQVHWFSAFEFLGKLFVICQLVSWKMKSAYHGIFCTCSYHIFCEIYTSFYLRRFWKSVWYTTKI